MNLKIINIKLETAIDEGRISSEDTSSLDQQFDFACYSHEESLGIMCLELSNLYNSAITISPPHRIYRITQTFLLGDFTFKNPIVSVVGDFDVLIIL